MRVVVCSDAHFDVSTAGVPRFEEVERAMREAAHHAARVRADAFIFLGDLCDPDSGPVVLRAADVAVSVATWLSSSGVPSFWVVGNHDVVNDGHGTTSLSPLRSLGRVGSHDVEVVDEPRCVSDGLWSHDFIFLPHVASTSEYAGGLGAAVRSLVEKGKPAIVFSHLSIAGVQPGEETTEMPRGAERMLPIEAIEEASPRVACVVSGHYHRRADYFLQDGEAREGDPGAYVPLHVVGSLARLTFGEEQNAPGFLVLEV